MAQVFKTYGRWARYISDSFYETIPIAYCIYCGDCWEVYDHVPPVSAWSKDSSWLFKYPACRDCNSILSSAPTKDIRKRRYIILKKLLRRHRSIINMPYWSEKDIREVVGYVKNFIVSSKSKQEHLLKRVYNLCENYIPCDGGRNINSAIQPRIVAETLSRFDYDAEAEQADAK